MSISLFPHNREAYEAACAMLLETGKACVIHPTGTGKSFIGFKLCEEHPEECICWLSPTADGKPLTSEAHVRIGQIPLFSLRSLAPSICGSCQVKGRQIKNEGFLASRQLCSPA